jgi:hypothetical protein
MTLSSHATPPRGFAHDPDISARRKNFDLLTFIPHGDHTKVIQIRGIVLDERLVARVHARPTNRKGPGASCANGPSAIFKGGSVYLIKPPHRPS